MKFYLAPMEGLTGHIFRRTYQKYFHNIDRYFTPFIVNKKLSSKEKNDILPENNPGMCVIPQIMSNNAEDFLQITKEIEKYGYDTVNLNLGCPSGTVVNKKRGAGFLAYPQELDDFLAKVYDESTLKISIKTRIGMNSEEEWGQLLDSYKKYPLEELIIHPRIQKDFYKHTPRMDAYQKAVEEINVPLCYNGDIYSVERYQEFRTRFPETERVMLGRGILKNPGLVDDIKRAGMKENASTFGMAGTYWLPHADCLPYTFGVQQENEPPKLTKETLRAFCDDICREYSLVMSGEKNTLFKMKELWSYMGQSFTEPEKYLKKIRKAERLSEYQVAVAALFREQELK